MPSKRELILARVEELLGTIDGPKTVLRNRGLADNDMRPALILLDGDEFSRTTGDKRGRVAMSPQIMELRPQVFIVMDVRWPQNADLGPDINALKWAIEQALANDQNLIDLVGTNGNILLLRAETDLKSGSAVRGQLRLDFTLTYVLDPYL
jgi:hypothetical protein